jgi:hypothetical protein
LIASPVERGGFRTSGVRFSPRSGSNRGVGEKCTWDSFHSRARAR